MVFPVVIYGYESWTIKKAECQRIDAFQLWCWRRLLRVPWTARRSNQSILKEINPEYSLEGLMLKLKFQYFGHLIQRANSLEKTLMLGKTEGGRRRGWQRMRWLMASLIQWTWVEQALGVGDGQGSLVCCSPWGCKDLGMTEQLNWLSAFPDEANGKEPACQCRRHKRRKFDPWVSTIPWKRAWQSTSVFLHRKSHRQRSLVGYSPWGCRVGLNWAHMHFGV